jgi:hypothetical protein
MKNLIYLSLFSIIVFYLSSCKKADNTSPGLSDEFLNYEIQDVPVTKDYLVGVNYLYAPTYGNALYKTLFAKTPNIGEYANIKSSIVGTTALVVDSQLVQMNRAKIDFVIVTIRSGTTANSSYKTDTAYVNRILSSRFRGNIKIAFAYDFSGLALGSVYPSPSDSSMLIERKPNALTNYIKDYTAFLAPYFSNPGYLKLGTKNVVFLLNGYRLFAKNNSIVTTQLRAALTAINQEIYLVGQQAAWSPPDRYEHRFHNAVDAIYHANYLSIPTNDLVRFSAFHQCTDQAWKYSKTRFNTWGIEYVPNIGPSYNSNLNSPNAISPYYNPYFTKDSVFFVKYCNIAKASSDVSKLILIDSWNTWSYDAQIEPAKQYGDRYLKILRDQFKLK